MGKLDIGQSESKEIINHIENKFNGKGCLDLLHSQYHKEFLHLKVIRNQLYNIIGFHVVIKISYNFIEFHSKMNFITFQVALTIHTLLLFFFFTFQVVLTISCILLIISYTFFFITFHIILKTSYNFVLFLIVLPILLHLLHLLHYISGCLEKNVTQYLSDNRGENVCGDRRNERRCYQITKI